ncbi:hypothetical protein D3C85_1660070 [compost metagenome]
MLQSGKIKLLDQLLRLTEETKHGKLKQEIKIKLQLTKVQQEMNIQLLEVFSLLAN